MAGLVKSFIDGLEVFFAWMATSVKQTTESYCSIQTADSETALVAHDGSLVTVMRVRGVQQLIGTDEFERIQEGVMQSLQNVMSRPGCKMQVFFSHDYEGIGDDIKDTLKGGRATAKRLSLELDDLFDERVEHLSKYCARENVFIVLWTMPSSLTKDQNKHAQKNKMALIKEKKIPPFKDTQNLIAAIPALRELHDSLIRSFSENAQMLGLVTEPLEVHDAVYEMRRSVDVDFTDRDWRPKLPGDKITIREGKQGFGDVSDIMWPSLARQLFPRDAENIDLRSVRVGDKIYSTLYVDLFPKEIQPFLSLFSRTLAAKIPWRISFLVDSNGLAATGLRGALSAILAVTSQENRLISDSVNLLRYIDLNTDDVVVKLRVALATWAPEGEVALLRNRASQLAQAVQGWGSCEVSEISGDATEGVVSSMMGVSGESVATPSVAPLSDVVYMLPLFRPCSPWDSGAMLFRSPDGKLWPYQPGSRRQTTWIDLVYARPGSGKSVLSNAMNLALCLSPGIPRLPRISIVDIGPSSSGLVSLLREALPVRQQHMVAYYRLRMTPDYAINPFDTQLGCRKPTAQERSFLVNFLTLLATPVGSETPYDGITDMVGMVVDEMYGELADDGNPHQYASNVEELIDGLLEEIGFIGDQHTTWWEVTDALFNAGFAHEAMLAQRHAVPVLADAASICRNPAVEDLYGKIVSPTGEPLVTAFARMISSAVREYPIIGQVTAFDLGEARIVSLDLDEVAKSGGDASNRQTAVMYMLARYVLAKDFYLTEENAQDMPESYRKYHKERILEIREDHKRIVYDEFHRTANSIAVRNQVVVDMREGRKWKVQVALLSQSLDDFDSVMIEFATSIFIMDAGPEQAVKKTTEVFGLTPTAEYALRNRVHGPKEGGATFLAMFATKSGSNTQLLTSTLGPIELWSFSTTAEDANIRNRLYQTIGPKETRRVLSKLFPSGSATKMIESRLAAMKEEEGMIDEDAQISVVESIIKEILDAYAKNPNMKGLD